MEGGLSDGGDVDSPGGVARMVAYSLFLHREGDSSPHVEAVDVVPEVDLLVLVLRASNNSSQTHHVPHRKPYSAARIVLSGSPPQQGGLAFLRIAQRQQ